PIQDQVFNEVQKIGANRKYDFIFDKSADVVMLYSEKRHDISELVLREIGRTRKISKPKKKEVQRSKLEEFEGETVEPISDALQERQDRAAEAADARAKSVDEKRAEQLRLREERKKAYEERRKKLLEEREARKKAKEEDRKKLTEKEKDTIN
ncbi:MAG: OmpH family outer membrane protein, partial [Bacteroidia bacterium]|nr:OmpH family outer membrane protein [Bacteroidia bacterium]